MKKIPLTQGKFALVDDADYEYLSRFKWHLTAYGYAARRYYFGNNSTIIYMHREVNGAKKGQLVDHINRDRLDNRRINLRLCTKQTNAINSKLNKRNTSGYRGVSWDKVRKKWVAMLYVKGKCFNLGGYITIEDAAEARNTAALKYHGKFARLNNVPSR